MSEKLTPTLIVENKERWSREIVSSEQKWRDQTFAEDLARTNTIAVRVLFDMVQDLCERIEKLEPPDA